MYKKKQQNQTGPESEPVMENGIPASEAQEPETVAPSETEEPSVQGNELEGLKAEVAQYKESYLRATADFQNYKRRAEKEKADIYKYAGEKLLIDLLPIVDNIERAMNHVSEEEQSGLADGVRMIGKSLTALLEKHGVEPIVALGEVFDPEVHHAVQMVSSEDHEPHRVVEEYQKGYKLNGKVIRHSMVKVSE